MISSNSRMPRVPFARLCLLLVGTLWLPGQQPPADVPLAAPLRAAVIQSLVSKIEAGYVVPEAARDAVRRLQSSAAAGDYDVLTGARGFAAKITADLREATHDKHIALYFDPEAREGSRGHSSPAPRERYNHGFHRIERLPGNVGYLDLRAFANLDEAKETASTFLSALAGFDSIIIDLRQNGGGNTPMVAWVASYFLGPKPVHLTSMYWRDENRTIEVSTSETVTGRRSLDRDLFLLVGPSTFSAAEDFCYSLQQLKRATVVGQKTGGGAHMGRGLQRLSPLFTAFIPTGKSFNPITKRNWENTGVEPDVNVPAAKALSEAHRLALGRLMERERDPDWQEHLRQSLARLVNEK